MNISADRFFYLYGVLETARNLCNDDETYRDILTNVITVLDDIRKEDEELHKSNMKLLNE